MARPRRTVLVAALAIALPCSAAQAASSNDNALPEAAVQSVYEEVLRLLRRERPPEPRLYRRDQDYPLARLYRDSRDYPPGCVYQDPSDYRLTCLQRRWRARGRNW